MTDTWLSPEEVEKVRELIAADLEYDAARFLYQSDKCVSKSADDPIYRRLIAAKHRRKEALAACLSFRFKVITTNLRP